MNMHEHRRKRLAALLRDRYQNDRRKFCDDSNLSESRLGQLLSSTYRNGLGFGEKAARRLEKRLGLNPLYFELLMIGETSAHLAYRKQSDSSAEPDDMVFVRQVTLKMTAGNIQPDIEEVMQAQAVLCLHRDWLGGHSILPEQLIAVAIDDASMAPRLNSGDIAVINTHDTVPQDNDVYLINYNGNIVVRRMTRDFGNWFLSADNNDSKLYHREEFVADTSEVLGRVVFLAGPYN
jgi:hypothetical protein